MVVVVEIGLGVVGGVGGLAVVRGGRRIQLYMVNKKQLIDIGFILSVSGPISNRMWLFQYGGNFLHSTKARFYQSQDGVFRPTQQHAIE